MAAQAHHAGAGARADARPRSSSPPRGPRLRDPWRGAGHGGRTADGPRPAAQVRGHRARAPGGHPGLRRSRTWVGTPVTAEERQAFLDGRELPIGEDKVVVTAPSPWCRPVRVPLPARTSRGPSGGARRGGRGHPARGTLDSAGTGRAPASKSIVSRPCRTATPRPAESGAPASSSARAPESRGAALPRGAPRGVRLSGATLQEPHASLRRTCRGARAASSVRGRGPGVRLVASGNDPDPDPPTARPDWNLQRRLQGRSDTPLNDTGRSRHAAVGRELAARAGTGRAGPDRCSAPADRAGHRRRSGRSSPAPTRISWSAPSVTWRAATAPGNGLYPAPRDDGRDGEATEDVVQRGSRRCARSSRTSPART
ncbi:histidine phosphatase family protein [Kocuria rhizophila]|nr:histidine phosphatase family protein [Kocuria rhizophila]